MKKLPRISEAELEIMKILWAENPLTSAEVINSLEGFSWSPQTIKTMLGRLVRKGALTYTSTDNRFNYKPLVSRDEFLKSTVASFSDRLLNEQPLTVLASFISSADLDREGIEQLRGLLDSKERDLG